MTNLLDDVRRRENDPAMAEAAQMRADMATARLRPTAFMVENLAAQAKKATQPVKKVMYLRKMADVLGTAMTGIAACRKGCSHCCNIPVIMSESEARVIARESGRPMTQPAQYSQIADPAYIGQPCPFLANGQCDIYAHRPVACRLQYNMDGDDLLCHLVPGEKISVPYFNSSYWQLHYASAMLPNHEKIADIRDFFPATV